MSETAIQVENLTKIYKLYQSPRDRLKETFHPFRKRYHQAFYALKNITFDVASGQTIGIIGRNGAGKSTLLKILTSVLSPSSGTYRVNGKVSSLLELGTGFNPELTGYENIFFNGAIFGYSRQEIESKMDAIIEFAAIGEFIGQKVKTYSSGMFVRLAFSVAISVDPDILIVDEALAVGDELFQRKCYSRIKQLKQNGTTILFVSHGSDSIIQLCDHALLLDRGTCILAGAPKFVVAKYQKLLYAPADKLDQVRQEIQKTKKDKGTDIPEGQNAAKGDLQQLDEGKKKEEKIKPFFDPGFVSKSRQSYESCGAKIQNVEITTLEGELVNNLIRRQDYYLRYRVAFSRDASKVRFGMLIKNITGVELGGASTDFTNEGIDFVAKGDRVDVLFRFSAMLLPGSYFINVGVGGRQNGSETFLHRILDAVVFKVIQHEKILETKMIDFNIDSSVKIHRRKNL